VHSKWIRTLLQSAQYPIIYSGQTLTSISSPILYFCITSRASLECPTSSNSSVASLPACSNRTSSPPGCCNHKRNGLKPMDRRRVPGGTQSARGGRDYNGGGHTSFRNSVTSYMQSLITIHGLVAFAFSTTSAIEYFFTSFSVIVTYE